MGSHSDEVRCESKKPAGHDYPTRRAARPAPAHARCPLPPPGLRAGGPTGHTGRVGWGHGGEARSEKCPPKTRRTDRPFFFPPKDPDSDDATTRHALALLLGPGAPVAEKRLGLEDALTACLPVPAVRMAFVSTSRADAAAAAGKRSARRAPPPPPPPPSPSDIVAATVPLALALVFAAPTAHAYAAALAPAAVLLASPHGAARAAATTRAAVAVAASLVAATAILPPLTLVAHATAAWLAAGRDPVAPLAPAAVGAALAAAGGIAAGRPVAASLQMAVAASCLGPLLLAAVLTV